MIKIKVLSRGINENGDSQFKKQTIGSTGLLNNCKFIFEPYCDDYDWLVVIDDIPKFLKFNFEELKCSKEHTILVTTEPSSITHYGKSFSNQFSYVITNQDDKSLFHKNKIYSQTGNKWFYGKSYDLIKSSSIPPAKIKKISTVCSNKQQGHTVHRKRFEFTAKLQDEIQKIERFGKGYNWIDFKYNAIDNYEFHVAIENHYAPHVWTEKLADTFLGFAVPIYYGCPNIYDYFPEDSIILIDIYDVEGSIKKIKEIISTPGEYERRLPAIKEARRRVIEEYNLLAMIDKIVTENSNSKKSEISPYNKIYGRRKMRTKNYFDLFSFIGWKIKNFFLNFGANR